MSTYNYKDFGRVLQLIRDFNKKHGLKKNGISYTQINQWFFKGYANLITHVETDRINKDNPNSEKRRNNNGLYGKWSVSEIVEILISEFDIPKKILEKEDKYYEIKPETVSKLKERFLELKEESTQFIYLIGSTYQGKQLEVAPRSIFILDLKSKKVTFEYYRDKSQVPIQLSKGTVSGNNLVYFNFQDLSNKKMYILKKGPLPWEKVLYLQGTYIGDDGSSPMAGAIFCEQVEDYPTAQSKLHKEVGTGIQYRLLYSQIRQKEEGIADRQQLSNHHFNTAAQEIQNNFKGSYYGCYLSSQGFHAILQAKLELKPDGSAIFYGHHNKAGEKGWIYLSGDKKTIYLRFKYNEKLNIFKYFITLSHDGARFYGSFGGGSNFTSLPETGRIIFLKIENRNTKDIPVGIVDVRDKDALNLFLNHSKVGGFNQDAINFLLGEPIIHRENDFSDTPAKVFKGTPFDPNFGVHEKSNPNHPENQAIPETYLGVYSGYIVQYFNDHPNYRVQKISLKLSQSKYVLAVSKNRNYKGKALHYVEDKKLNFYLAHKEDYPEIHHILEITSWKDYNNIVLRGTYTGTGRTAQNHPIGGRIIFFKEKEGIAIEEIEVRDYSLSDAQDMSRLESEVPGLLEFFLGLKDNMVEGYGLFKESGFLPITHTPYKEIKNQVSGYYLSFRIRTDLSTISVVPLIIDSWGNVKMKSTQKLSQYEYKEYSGICEINNDEVLSLRFHFCGNRSLFAQSKFNKSDNIVDTESNKILMGIFSSSNSRQNRPFACKQILIFQEKDISNYHDTLPEYIEIPIYPKPASPRFKELNEKYNNIMNYLIGDEYNMIRMSRGPRIKSVEKGEDFKKKIDYSEVFFLAALKYYDLGHRASAKNMWEYAILNGFRENNLVDQLREKHSDAFKFFNDEL